MGNFTTNSAEIKKIVVFGRPGSGKSEFAHKLSHIKQLPVYHLDKYYFTEGWKKRDYKEFMRDQYEILSKKEWIIDGNCIQSLEMRAQYADLIIYFDIPRLICLWRMFKRVFHKNTDVDDRADGCREQVRLKLINYMWKFSYRVKEIIYNLQTSRLRDRFYIIKTDKEAHKLLNCLINNNHSV